LPVPQALAVDVHDAALEDRPEEVQLAAKVIVNGRQVHLGFACHLAQRGGLEALLGEQGLGRVEDARAGVGGRVGGHDSNV
jgi:hypothetical protein